MTMTRPCLPSDDAVVKGDADWTRTLAAKNAFIGCDRIKSSAPSVVRP